MKKNSLFLQLIRPFPPDSAFEIDKNDLGELKSLSLKYNLFPLVYIRLHKYKDCFSPGQFVIDFLDETKGLYWKSIATSMKQEAVEKEIICLLGNNAIPSLVIKGNEIAREIYDDPNCRISSDVDILIRKADAINMDSLLTGAGYVPEENMPLAYCLSRIHHLAYHHPENNVLIEIHWGFGVPYFFKLESDEIWNRIIYTDTGRRKLSPEVLVIMLLIHHHSHSFRELKILVDILWALHRYEDVIDWKAFSQKIQVIGLVKTTLMTIWQIQSLWPERIDELKSIQIFNDELNKIGCRVPRYLSEYFRMDLDMDYAHQLYRDKLVARFALDKLSTTVFSFLKTLFPVPEAIKELYQDSRNCTLPVNYLKFIAWRVREWTNKTEVR